MNSPNSAQEMSSLAIMSTGPLEIDSLLTESIVLPEQFFPLPMHPAAKSEEAALRFAALHRALEDLLIIYVNSYETFPVRRARRASSVGATPTR